MQYLDIADTVSILEKSGYRGSAGYAVAWPYNLLDPTNGRKFRHWFVEGVFATRIYADRFARILTDDAYEGVEVFDLRALQDSMRPADSFEEAI